jgi:hypothetical protein
VDWRIGRSAVVCSPAVRGIAGTHRRAVGLCAVGLLGLTGCGAPKGQEANEPRGDYTIEIERASFPTRQRLAQRSTLEIAVRNVGDKAVPNVAVTVEPVQSPNSPSALAFEEASRQPGLANPSRPVWVLDAGPRGGVTAYTNTWTLGRLEPGQLKTFVWRVTAVKSGSHAIKYTVAAGLDGRAKARLPGGEQPTGGFDIDISGEPADARVTDSGGVVVIPR